MSERVLHEWTTESGRRLSILVESDAFGKGEVGIGVDGEIDSSLGWGLALARELARLAARISELEAENARLRKCVAEARLAMMEPHGEWKDVREAKALNMIRAEVDK